MTNSELIDLFQGILQHRSSADYTQFFEEKVNFILSQFEHISSTVLEPIAQMTKMTILFEGFYRHLSDGPLKAELLRIRSERWKEHFGTPTLLFLLSYKQHIDETQQFFTLFSEVIDEVYPWSDLKLSDPVVDSGNQTINSLASLSRVVAPAPEVTGFFTKTHNPFGGFSTTPCDPVSQEFIQHAEEIAQHGGKILEVGAAFGAATLAALSKGATVYCNDIEADNLAVVRQRYASLEADENLSATGDAKKLILVPGALPDELAGLPEKCFDAILICRVLHFFTGKKIEESLGLLSKLLTLSGKIYIVCETPFLRNWQRFIPEYQRRVDIGLEWPGEITNPAEFESSGRAASLPKFVHWITKEILERSLVRAGLSIEHADYINREGQFPEDLLLPEHGKESVGAIAKLGGKS